MPRLLVGDINLYYEIGGQGPKLLYLGGTGADLRQAPGVMQWPLVKHFQVLAFDQRGQGRSDKPDRPYSMADYANDAADLLRALHWRPCPVVGFSFGAMVAQELALRHTSLVTRLALLCGPAGGQGGRSYPLHRIWDLPLEERARKLLAQSDLRRDEAWQRANPEQWRALVEDMVARQAIGLDEPDHAMGALRQLEARKHHDAWDRLGFLAMPVLALAGRYDGVAPLSAMEKLAGRIPGARLEVFEGGHYFHLQDPRAFEEIIAFCLADRGET